MAASSLSSILLAFPKTKQLESTFGSSHPKLLLPPQLTLSVTTSKKPTTRCKASQTNSSSSMSSTITQLQAQQNGKPLKQNEQPIGDLWRKIHGKDNWAGLLDPMDPIMRLELIRYGEMAQACYDSFDFDPYSKYCGSCRYSHDQFFEALDLPHIGYTITRYLYATANVNVPSFFKKSRWPDKYWSESANWMGYVAVSDDETTKRIGRRDIVIAFRGTVTHIEWVANLVNFLKPVYNDIPCPDKDVRVEAGFLDMYTDKETRCGYCKYSTREQVLAEVKRLVEKYPNEEVSVTLTGHSLGSALATLGAYDIAESGLNVGSDGKKLHVSVFSFSGPRVGNVKFKGRLESHLGVKVLRVHNAHDMVPKSPGFLINEKSPAWLLKVAEDLDMPWCYTHVGVELELDHKISPYLNHSADAACAHNLEAHLHLLDGYQGSNGGFEPTIKRDLALINKDCDFLRDEHSVPPKWRQDWNRNMVKNEEGRWVMAERPKLVDHPEDIDRYLIELGLAKSESSSSN